MKDREFSTNESAHEQLQRVQALLSSLRAKLEKHPELEEAIERLEIALSALTVRTGGML